MDAKNGSLEDYKKTIESILGKNIIEDFELSEDEQEQIIIILKEKGYSI